MPSFSTTNHALQFGSNSPVVSIYGNDLSGYIVYQTSGSFYSFAPNIKYLALQIIFTNPFQAVPTVTITTASINASSTASANVTFFVDTGSYPGAPNSDITTTYFNISGISSINTLLGPQTIVLSYQVNGIGTYANSLASAQTITVNNVGTGQLQGLTVVNTTPAANNAQQYAPIIESIGYGWSTTAANPQTVKFGMQTVPIQGSTNPTGALVWYKSVNGSAYSEVGRLDTSGNFTIQGSLTVGSGALTGLGSSYGSATSSSQNIINLTSTGGTVKIQDNATPLSTAFAITNSAGNTTYFNVASTLINAGASIIPTAGSIYSLGSGSFPWADVSTGELDLTQNNTGSTTNTWLNIWNTTSASNVQAQNSPGLGFRGASWISGASSTQEFQNILEGSTSGAASLHWLYRSGGSGSWTDIGNLDASGNFTISGTLTSTASSASSNRINGKLGINTVPSYGLHLLGGSARVQILSNPSAPTVTPTGTTGSTTYTYYIVANDQAGNKTLASTATTITNGNATLSGTNYNALSWTAVGNSVSYDVIRSAGGTSQGSIALATTATSLNDTGLSASAYSSPTRNSTGDLTVDGNINGTLALNQTTVTTDYTALTTDYYIICNPGSTMNLTLPTGSNGLEYIVKIINGSSVNIQTTGGQTIDGALSFKLYYAANTNASVRLRWDTTGATWRKLAYAKLQDVYNAGIGTADSRIQVDSTRGGIVIGDNGNGVAPLLSVQALTGIPYFETGGPPWSGGASGETKTGIHVNTSINGYGTGSGPNDLHIGDDPHSSRNLYLGYTGLPSNVDVIVNHNLTVNGILITAGTINLGDGAVTQATSLTTGVTINVASGVITTVSATTAAGSTATFTVTNSAVTASSSVVLVALGAYSGTFGTNGTPLVTVSLVSAGSFNVTIYNAHASNALSGTLKINFAVV